MATVQIGADSGVGQADIDLATIEKIIRDYSQGNDEATLEAWLSHATLCRYRDWVPRPGPGQTTLLDVGCYQPSIGYYLALGWQHVVGIGKEEGEMASALSCAKEGGRIDMLILDVERQKIPLPDESVDQVLMMEIFEHFGLDPMHALVEINRVLKPGGTLIFSTPNAAAYDNLARILRGLSPFDHLEFSGFSTNRHNRLYDCLELREILADAGFEPDVCTSRSYPTSRRSFGHGLFRGCVGVLDRLLRLYSADKRARERHDFIFLVARKVGSPRQRYPKYLYFDQERWPSWFKMLEEKMAEG